MGTVQPSYVCACAEGARANLNNSTESQLSSVGDGGEGGGSAMAYSRVTSWAQHWVCSPQVWTLVGGVFV